jgi:hypothetical protein
MTRNTIRWAVIVLAVIGGSGRGGTDGAAVEIAPAKAYRIRADDRGLQIETREGGSLRLDHPRILTARGTWRPRDAAPTVSPERLSYDHGAWKEEFVLRPDALQQMFVLREPVREECSVRIPVRSEATPVAVDPKTIAFVDPGGRQRMIYRDAIAMDRTGHLQELSLSVEGNEISIRLPGEYLARASFPVLIDPLVGSPVTLSPAGGLWRIPGIHIAWNSRDRYYLAVWHQDLVFNLPHLSHPSHNWLNQSIVRARAIQIDPLGNIVLGDPISATKPYVGITLGPVTAGFAAFGPRVRYNPVTNEFLALWAEGQWFLNGTFYDTSVYGDAVTDLNSNGVAEYAYCQEPYPSNSRITGVRVQVDPGTLHVSVAGTPVEVSMAADGTPGAPSGTDTTAIHPSILPDVSWDGLQYVVSWETLEVPTLGAIQAQSFGEYRHVFRSQSRVRYRLLDPACAPTSTFTDLSDPKERFFLKGPTSDPLNIVDGSVPTNLKTELAYDSVPTDPAPHVDSLILPGPDGKIGTADDIPAGSLIIWNVTSLTFDIGKSRVRGRFLPAGGQLANIVWDIFSSSDNAGATLPTQFVQRATVAAGSAVDVPSSHFLVAFESVEDVVRVGTPKVEFVGSLKMRMVQSTGGAPIGDVIDIAASNPSTNTFYLSPTVAWCREAKQYFLAWSQTDTLWNPVTLGTAYDPAGGTFTEVPSQLFGTIATAYPSGAACSYSAAIDPLNPDSADHHVLFTGQEDDFGANYVRRYKFVAASGPGSGGGPSASSSGGGSGSGSKVCGIGAVSPAPGGVLLFAAALGILTLGLPRRRTSASAARSLRERGD